MAKRMPGYELMKDEYDAGDAWLLELPMEDAFGFGSISPSSPEIKRPEKLNAAKEKLLSIDTADAGRRSPFRLRFRRRVAGRAQSRGGSAQKRHPGKRAAKSTRGRGYGIIEDCGGPDGLKKIAAAFKRKRGPQYLEFCEWLETDSLDLTAFDIEDMNFRLKKVPKIYRKIYENGQSPSRQSMKILTREYLKQ